MPRGRPTGPRNVVVPEGYLTVRDAAGRLGLSPNMLRKLMARGTLPSIAGPRQAKGRMRFVPVAAVEGYQPQRRGRRPGTPNAKPRRIRPVAPLQPNGQGHARPRLVTTAQTPAKVWALLERLESYRRELWADLQASPSAAVREEWYLLLRRLLYAELAVLEKLFAEVDVEGPEGIEAERMNWFAEDGEEEDDG